LEGNFNYSEITITNLLKVEIGHDGLVCTVLFWLWL